MDFQSAIFGIGAKLWLDIGDFFGKHECPAEAEESKPRKIEIGRSEYSPFSVFGGNLL